MNTLKYILALAMAITTSTNAVDLHRHPPLCGRGAVHQCHTNVPGTVNGVEVIYPTWTGTWRGWNDKKWYCPKVDWTGYCDCDCKTNWNY